MANLDTIREALRRCPVTRRFNQGPPLLFKLTCDPHGIYRWRDAKQCVTRCERGEAESRMIAAWVEALRRAGHLPAFGERQLLMRDNLLDADHQPIPIGDGTDGLLHALAAAVCAVMPEPEDKR